MNFPPKEPHLRVLYEFVHHSFMLCFKTFIKKNLYSLELYRDVIWFWSVCEKLNVIIRTYTSITFFLFNCQIFTQFNFTD